MIRKSFSLTLMFAICGLLTSNVNADIVYSTATFQNMVITQNDPSGFAITADVIDGGVTTGVLTASYAYGAGSDPFSNGNNWGPTATDFNINGTTGTNSPGTDTATGDWNISVAAVAGYQVDGISVYSNATALGNPTISNIVSNGIATVCENTDLIANVDHGDVIPNGGSLDFNAGSSVNGILNGVHSREWAINADASALSFTYAAGFDEVINNVASEGLRLDVQTSVVPVPEPASAGIIGLGMAIFVMRRRR